MSAKLRKDEDIREFAKAATPGPWKSESNHVYQPISGEEANYILEAEVSCFEEDKRFNVTPAQAFANAAYVAAVNPVVVTRILDERDDAVLRAELAEKELLKRDLKMGSLISNYDKEHSQLCDSVSQVSQELISLREMVSEVLTIVDSNWMNENDLDDWILRAKQILRGKR